MQPILAHPNRLPAPLNFILRPYFLGGLLLVVALATRLYFAARLPHPGHGDPAFYFTVAKNIAAGRGLELEYIWHFLTLPASVTHPGADYWMVLSSVLMSVPYFFFHTLFSILVLTSLFGLGIAVLAYRMSRNYTTSKIVVGLTFFYLLFDPLLFEYSLAIDSPIFYAFFVTLALYCISSGYKNHQMFVWAGFVSGIAHLTRQDALLLMPTLLFSIFVSPQPLKARIRWMGLAMCAYLLVLLPMFTYNLYNFGALLPPGPSRVAFAAEHEQVYVYSTELSLSSYLALGWQTILKQKLLTGLDNLRAFYDQIGLLIPLFAGITLFEPFFSRERRALRYQYLPIWIYLCLQLLFYTLVATVVSSHGSFEKIVLSMLPFLIMFALDGLERHIPNKFVGLLLVVFFVFPPLLTTFQNAEGKIAFHTAIHTEMTALTETLNHQIDPIEENEIILMTRNPWEVYLSTGYRTIMIPYEELDVIYEVAQRYRANYLILPASTRPALDNLKEIAETDPRFEFVLQVPGTKLKLYSILLDVP